MSATTTAICVIVMGTGGGTIRPLLPLVICASIRSPPKHAPERWQWQDLAVRLSGRWPFV
jgi:hypothetical protein